VTVKDWLEIGIPAGSAVVVAVLAWLSGRIGARAALRNSEATLRTAVAAERTAASADWAKFCEAQQKWNEGQADEIKDLDKRLGEAEMGRITAERRAAESDWHAAIAATYVRRLIRWVEERWPLGDYPRPPAELNLDIAG
jgi:hypothetical protein